MNVRA